jgi:hypothetical protein
MVQTEKTRSLAKQALYWISAHTAFFVLYYYAHGKLDLLYSLTENTPLFIIICFAPLAASLFLSTPSARPGAVILLGLMPAELIYNILARFTPSMVYNILEPSLLWKIIYEGSFGLVLVIEAITTWLAYKFLREIYKQSNSTSENPSEAVR